MINVLHVYPSGPIQFFHHHHIVHVIAIAISLVRSTKPAFRIECKKSKLPSRGVRVSNPCFKTARCAPSLASLVRGD